MGQAAPIAMIGLQALGAANDMSSAGASKRLNQARTRLQLAQAKREEAERLSQGLARQNVVAAARGATPNTGSLMRQALAASRQSRRRAGLAAGQAAFSDAQAANAARTARTRSLISFGESFVKQAPRLLRD